MMRLITKPSLWFFFLFASSPLCTSTKRSFITPTQPLIDGETLVSSGGTFALGFFTPSGNTKNNRYLGIWYNNISAFTVVWVANRNTPIERYRNSSLSITAKGNLTITACNSSSACFLWSLDSFSNLSNPVAKVLDTGNLVVKESDSSDDDEASFAWQSFDYPTDTLLPSMKLGPDFRRKLNRNLTAWKSASDPAMGNYALVMQTNGTPQLVMLVGGNRMLWRSGPWTGYQFSGVPETRTVTYFNFTYIDNPQEVYYSFSAIDNSITTQLVVNETGMTQQVVWLPGDEKWGLYYYTPKTACDPYNVCGNFGVCDINTSPMCQCLPGFVPSDPKQWVVMDYSSGCKRRTELECSDDGFIVQRHALLPDTEGGLAVVDMEVNLEGCRQRCLMNCSCTGFANANVREGGQGCITWSGKISDLELYEEGGQDLYVRLATDDPDFVANLPHDKKRAGKSLVVVAIVVSSTILTLLVLAYIFLYKIKKKQSRAGATINFHKSYNAGNREEDDFKLPILDISAVVTATDNFSNANKLGEGGFGPVFKGRLVDGQEIAVKKLGENSIQGVDEFKNEVMLISRLQHRNLVRLLGCCIHADERMLIYEYMPNKSLDTFLFGRENKDMLDWDTRYRIIIGTARGLLYLHHDSRFRIIHRDLKISNILLDHEMNPKISDFGMARIFSDHDTNAQTTRVVGTYGYMSPEYAMDGIFSTKSDVFSFGVLVLEIISGLKNKGVYRSEPECYLLGNAWALWKEDKGLELVDPSLGSSFSRSEVLKCINLGLLCVQNNPDDRPTMSSVVMMLDTDNPTMQEPNAPGFIAKSYYSSADSSSGQKRQSMNHLTITVLNGR